MTCSPRKSKRRLVLVQSRQLFVWLKAELDSRSAAQSWTQQASAGIAITVQLLDLQIQMGGQRLVIGLLSPGGGSLRASDNQGRFQRFDVV